MSFLYEKRETSTALAQVPLDTMQNGTSWYLVYKKTVYELTSKNKPKIG